MDKEEQKEHPADVADQLERLTVEQAQKELRDLPRAEGAAVLAEIDEETRPAVLENLAPSKSPDSSAKCRTTKRRMSSPPCPRTFNQLFWISFLCATDSSYPKSSPTRPNPPAES